MTGLLGTYFPGEDPMAPVDLMPRGLLGPSVLGRMQAHSDAQRQRMAAGDYSPTPMNEESMWLVDDLAGGLLGSLPGGLMMLGTKGASKADDIARLLRDGRAAEVTDEMLGALSPNDQARLFDLYESGATGMDLPMDVQSRMSRAREAGFNMTEAAPMASGPIEGGGGPSVAKPPQLFHGASEDFAAFSTDRYGTGAGDWSGRGIYTTPDALEAEGYGEFVMPLHSRAGSVETQYLRDYNWRAPENFAEYLKSQGYDALNMRVRDVDDRTGVVDADWLKERVDFDPANIRSRHARFDPRLSKNADLLAGMAGLSGLGLLGAAQAYPYIEGVE